MSTPDTMAEASERIEALQTALEGQKQQRPSAG